MKRTLLVSAIAGYFVLAIVWIFADRRASQHVYAPYSAANTAPAGLSQAYAYLDRDGRDVGMLTTVVREGSLPASGVLFRIGGFYEPLEVVGETRKKKAEDKRRRESPLLSDAEEVWVRDGGRLVIAVGTSAGTLDLRGVRNRPTVKVFPLFPGVAKLRAAEPRAFGARSLEPSMHAIFATGADVVMARQRIGKGDLFVLATPEIFRNEHLRKGDHLALLLALAETRPVRFDEAVHGIVSNDGALALMKEWGLGPFLLLGAIATALLFWRHGRHVGPPDDEAGDHRSDAVDLVASLGALYRRSTNDSESIRLYHEALTRAVAAQSGLRGDPLHKRVEQLTGGARFPRPGETLPKHRFDSLLQVLNDAFRGMKHEHHR